MAKSLVIVESPAKAKTINKFLGKAYVVKASMGHVRDLPKGKFGIDVDHDFAPLYQTIRGRGDALADLRKAAKAAGRVFLAPDHLVAVRKAGHGDQSGLVIGADSGLLKR